MIIGKFLMARKLKIELEDEVSHQLNKLFKGDEIVMHDYIAQVIKEKLNQSNSKNVPEKKESLKNYLNKGHSSNRNYGVKGQGW